MTTLEKERRELRRRVLVTQAAQLYGCTILGATGADLTSGIAADNHREAEYTAFVVVWSILVAGSVASAFYYAWNYYQLTRIVEASGSAPFLKMPS